LLDDYDKEAQIKEKRAKKAEEERKKAEEEERKRREREEKKLINSSPGLLGRLRRKLNDLIEDNGDGNDLDD
jgi:hypothetical protein